MTTECQRRGFGPVAGLRVLVPALMRPEGRNPEGAFVTRKDIPISYEQAVNIVGSENGKKTVCNNTVVQVDNRWPTSGLAYVLLHGHKVATFQEFDESVQIDSCGWRTVTTKDRINRCLGRRGQVFQRDYKWFYRDHLGTVTPFQDGMFCGSEE